MYTDLITAETGGVTVHCYRGETLTDFHGWLQPTDYRELPQVYISMYAAMWSLLPLLGWDGKIDDGPYVDVTFRGDRHYLTIVIKQRTDGACFYITNNPDMGT